MAAKFEGKVAIVTGSSAGLGETIALLFASRGASVILCGRDQERLKSVLDKSVQANGGHKDRILTVQGDLNDHDVRKRIVDQTVEKFGRLDILVANAGISGPKDSITETTEEAYDSFLNTNLKSVFFLIQHAVPHLEKTRGNIISISSIATYMVSPGALVYSLSKVALDHLTKSLAIDLGKRGIRVNSVNPSFFPTLILRNYGPLDELNRQVLSLEDGKTALAGRTGVNKDVAEAVLFLASDEVAGFITGEFLKVDGGRYSTGPFSTS